MNTRTIAVTAVGCKVNQYDSAAMLALFTEAGFTSVSFDSPADIYIISTCTVTAIADKKSRQMINRAHRLNPNAVVCAAGCLSQKEGETLKTVCDVDIVIGNADRHNIVSTLMQYLDSKDTQPLLADIRKETEYETLSLAMPTEKTRALIKIQEGCNNFCSYCIIPYVRGRARSRHLENILEEIRSVVKHGAKEVVLTGIHISSYGQDFENNINLSKLLLSLNHIDGLYRVRLGSLEPKLINREFCEAASKVASLCPHFHLSLQSGSASVLKRMNRKYTPEEYKQAIALLREYFENPAITTDVIVGFPCETNEEFEETCRFVKEIGFSKMHVFPYSIRTGTPAAKMTGQISNATKKERVSVLLHLDDIMQDAYIRRFIGNTESVLFETHRFIYNRQPHWVYHKVYYGECACKS